MNKHRKINDGKTKKKNYYFRTGKYCPFEDLGCKFLHLYSDNQEERKPKTLNLDEGLGSFHTSTPKKPFEDCEEFLDGSKCTDCIVKHVLGQHACAKLTFS